MGATFTKYLQTRNIPLRIEPEYYTNIEEQEETERKKQRLLDERIAIISKSEVYCRKAIKNEVQAIHVAKLGSKPKTKTWFETIMEFETQTWCTMTWHLLKNGTIIVSW